MTETTTDVFEGYTGPALELSATEFEALTNDTTADAVPIMCNEPGCMNSIDKPARGRTPKFCVEHKPSTRTPQPRGTNRGVGESWGRRAGAPVSCAGGRGRSPIHGTLRGR